MNALAGPPQSRPFPQLRQDLSISEAPRENNSSPIYILADLARHKFFQIGQAEIEELATAAPVEGEPSPLVNFLHQNELVVSPAHGSGSKFAEKAQKSKQGILTAMLHGYLYFRIPLLNPEKLQNRLWPTVCLFLSRQFFILTAIAGIMALFLMSRHWQEFMASFASMLSVSGLATYALAFAFIKLLHEGGHAFMSYRYKVPVPSIGIAFMMFYPVLYTETSAAWRLPKRQRMLIGAAGMAVELTLAIWASLLWAFVPDGAFRGILFAIATTGWFLTLAVNLNPLMRFDGYFLASDLVSVPNLQDRSYAIAKWALREFLFAAGEPKPEEFPLLKTIGLVVFAIATWIYRFFLYLGIALLVYHFAVKLLGIFLFIVEIAWFIVLPLWREGKHWWQNRMQYFTTPAGRKSALVFIILCIMFFLPLNHTISAPAMLTANKIEQIHAKTDAQIVKSYIYEGKKVMAGDVLLELSMPDHIIEINKAEASIQLAKTKLMRLASDAESRSQRQIIEEEMARALQKRNGLEALANDRAVRAPFDGQIVNVESALHEGRWIGPATTLAVIKSTQGGEILALGTDTQIKRISANATATFLPDDFMHQSLSATLIEVDNTGAARLPFLELADTNGGPIATVPAQSAETVPVNTYAKLRFATASSEISLVNPQRGIVHIQASGESLATKIFRRIAAVLIMESGF